MRPAHFVAAAAAVVITGIASVQHPATAQQPACLHGASEIDAERTRRQQALRLTRDINTQQAAVGAKRGYQPVALLPLTAPVPQGFDVHLVTDGQQYSFSVKDTLDPCAFAYFSDEGGRVYTGEGLR